MAKTTFSKEGPMQVGLLILGFHTCDKYVIVNPVMYQLYQFQVVDERKQFTSVGQVILSVWVFSVPSSMDALNVTFPYDTKVFTFSIITYN